MCGQDDAPWRVWVFRRDDIREIFGTEWRRGYETVLFYVPIELAEGGGDIVADESMVFGAGCTSAGFTKWKRENKKADLRTRSGDQDLLEMGKWVGRVEVLQGVTQVRQV